MQNQLIPDSVFLLPLLQEIAAKPGAPIQVELAEDFGQPITVTSWDDIRIDVDEVTLKSYRVTLELSGHVSHFELRTDQPVSPFHAALVTETLRRSFLDSGLKVVLKAERREGADLFSVGVEVAPGPLSIEPEVFLMAQAWLELAGRVERKVEQRSLRESAEERVNEIRDERAREAQERRRREQLAQEADMRGAYS